MPTLRQILALSAREAGVTADYSTLTSDTTPRPDRSRNVDSASSKKRSRSWETPSEGSDDVPVEKLSQKKKGKTVLVQPSISPASTNVSVAARTGSNLDPGVFSY